MLFSKDNYMVLSTELHLSKSNECHQLFLLCGGIMFISHELEDVGMVFPLHFYLEFHPSIWLFVHLSDSV